MERKVRRVKARWNYSSQRGLLEGQEYDAEILILTPPYSDEPFGTGKIRFFDGSWPLCRDGYQCRYPWMAVTITKYIDDLNGFEKELDEIQTMGYRYETV